MKNQGFNTTIVVDQSPEAVFRSINNPRAWWSEEIDGDTAQLGDEFIYRYKDVHICKMKLVEVIPNKKVVWLVLENYFSFTEDKHEWTGTKISFDLSREGAKTHLRFTHLGLTSEYECYEVCQKAWTDYIRQSLFDLITKGKGNPNSTD